MLRYFLYKILNAFSFTSYSYGSFFWLFDVLRVLEEIFLFNPSLYICDQTVLISCNTSCCTY